MKKKSMRYAFLVILLLAYFVKQTPVTVLAAEYTASLPKSADKGTVIVCKVEIADNSGLTTLGLRVIYDQKILAYKGAQWAEGFTNGNSSQGLVSDVEYQDKKSVNIAMIDSKGYQENGTLLTLYFEVLEEYTESPIEFIFRDATDMDVKAIEGKTYVVLLESEKVVFEKEEILMGLLLLVVILNLIAMVFIVRWVKKTKQGKGNE